MNRGSLFATSDQQSCRIADCQKSTSISLLIECWLSVYQCGWCDQAANVSLYLYLVRLCQKNTFCEKHSHVCVWCNHGSMVGSNYTNYTQNTRWSHFCRLFFLILNFTFCNAHCQNHLDPYSPNSGLCGSMWEPIMLLRETCGSHFCQPETALFAAMSACCHFGRCDTRAV